MKVVQGLPPNYDEISRTFHFDQLPAIFKPVFAYGDTLYNPTGEEVSDDLMAHEETHEEQQKILGAEQWWELYLTDEAFRLTQEVEAYRAQYISVQDKSRDFRRLFLQRLAKDLSSKLYGSIINTKQAKELIHG